MAPPATDFALLGSRFCLGLLSDCAFVKRHIYLNICSSRTSFFNRGIGFEFGSLKKALFELRMYMLSGFEKRSEKGMTGAKLPGINFGKVPSGFTNSGAQKTEKEVFGCFASVGKLAEARRDAFRRGVWFRALSRIERGVVDLTLRYVDNIKSAKLAKVLTAIMEKLQQATESMADRLVRLIGVPLAQKTSGIAVSWGNLSAETWANDRGFARYLAFTQQKT